MVDKGLEGKRIGFLNAATVVSLMVAAALMPILDGGFDNQVSYFVLFLLSIIGFAKFISTSKTKLENLEISRIVFMIFSIWCGLSLLWSVTPNRTVIELIQLLCGVMLFILAGWLSREEKLRLLDVVLLLGLALAIYGIAEHLFLGAARVQSTLTNPNVFASYLLLVIFLAWGKFLENPAIKSGAYVVILILALFFSGSRGGLIAWAVAVPFVFMMSKSRLCLKMILLSIVCVILAFSLYMSITMMTQSGSFQNRTLEAAAGLVREDSFSESTGGRFEYWKVAGELAQARPLQGFGFGSFYSAYYSAFHENQWYSRFAHNHYLQVLAETGVVGLLLFLMGIGGMIRGVMRESSGLEGYRAGAFAGAIAFLIHIGLDFSWNIPGCAITFFAIMGCVIVAEEEKHEFAWRIRLLTGVLLLMGLILPIWQFTADTLLLKALDAANQGNVTVAARTYEMANSVYPLNPMGYSLESDYYQGVFQKTKKLSDLDKAMQLARRATTISPFSWQLHFKVAELHIMKGSLKQAEASLQQAKKYSAYRLQPYIALTALYENQGNHVAAEQVFQEGLELSVSALKVAGQSNDRNQVLRELSQLHYLRAQILSNQGKLQESAVESDKADAYAK